MKKNAWAKVLSIVLVLVMTIAWLPMGIASATGGGAVPTDSPDVDSGGSDDNSFASGEVLALADSWEHAQAIADAYDLELKSYAYGIAVLSAPDPELIVSQSGLMRRAGVPKLGLNWIYHTNETAYKVDYKKDTYQPPATPYDPYLEVANRTATYRRTTFDESDDPDEPITGQWHRAEMDIDRAWELSTGTDVVIAVIDTGIDIDHPAFEGRISENSYNAYADESGLEAVRDDWGHGTHVSGIAAASLDSAVDVSGVAPDAELLVIKANISNTNEFASEDLYRAINYAVANDADIINLSLGRYYADGESADALEQAVIANAVNSGVTVVCAAGNYSSYHADYPAAYPESIAVSATRQGFQFDTLDSASNYGPEIDVAAPGGNIYSTVNGGGYEFMSGTSMASPNVAGTAALILALNPDYSPQQVRDTLRGTARDAGALGRDDYYGSGIVNAYAAVCGPDALCSVTYDFNDSIRDPIVVKVIPESTLLVPDVPLRDGYAFEGWFVSETEEEFDFATPVEDDCKLDAKWVEAKAGMYVLEFPDLNFRREVLRMLTEQDGKRRKDSSFVEDDLELLASMELLFLWGMGIYDMTGLQYFPGLRTLTVSFNQLTELDISGNTALEALYCPGNQLTELDVSAHTALVTLSCFGNRLTELDVTRNTALAYLYCDYNQLTELDVSKNTALEILLCYYNQLTKLDVSKNTALEVLECDGNELTELNVSKNIALTSLWCGWNQLTELDVTKSINLITLVCIGNRLTGLDVSQNTALELLECADNQIVALDVTKNTALIELSCGGNRLTSLDVSHNPELTGLWCRENPLNTLDVSKNPALFLLSCYNCQLTALDVKSNSLLYFLWCENNYLTGLDVSANPALAVLDCSYNYMASIDDVIGWDTLPELYTFIFYPQISGNPPSGQDITGSFKDAGFLAAVREIIGKPEGPILDYDVAWIQELNVSSWNIPHTISDLSGIEHFRSLTYLNCSDQQLTELDVSNNTALVYLSCSNNQLTGLDVTQNTELKGLDCSYNQLAALDISQNTALEDLYCSGNQLAALNISHNIGLWQLNCSYNQLTTLNVSQNSVLGYLFCYGNQLTALDVTKNTGLWQLDCANNQLTELDISQSSELWQLDCAYNQLAELDVSKNTALQYLYCSGNQLNAIDVSHNIALRDLWLDNNQLSTIDLSKNIALRNLYCFGNQLTALDVSKNIALQDLYFSENLLTALDVSKNTELWLLACGSNQLTALDLSNNAALRELYCSENLLTALDVSKNTALERLGCFGNQLTELDVSNNAALQFFDCTYNYMTSLDKVIGWQSNPGLILYETFLFYPQNSGNPPSGKDITDAFKDPGFLAAVREIIGKPEGPILDYDVAWIRDLNVSSWNIPYSISDLSGIEHFGSLTQLDCSGQQLAELDVSNNTALVYLSCYNNQLTGLDVTQNTGLETLGCGGNQLTALDVSKNTAIWELYCYGNKLTALDVTKNTELLTLDCSGNQLSTLDVTQNTKLKGLDCAYNQLTVLDVSQNTALEYLYCSGNQLAALDVSQNIALWNLDCAYNQLTVLDTTQNIAFQYLYCFGNQLTELDVSTNIKLEWLDCTYNYMKSIEDVAGWQTVPGLILNDTFRFYPQWEALFTSIEVTTPTIVESLAANLRIITEGENLEGKRLIAYLSVNGDLRCRTDITNGDLMRISAADAPAYGDECKVVVKVDDGNVQGDFAMNVAEYKPEKLWTADVSMADGKLLITFYADTALKSTRNCVTIGGKTYNAVVLTDKRTVEIQGFSGILEEGTTVIVSGVKFPELFPSYSFTFTLQR